tara:strand:+ start:10 stop:543 length:534 start_codon:yes stop_codon:yes gene_type:complete
MANPLYGLNKTDKYIDDATTLFDTSGSGLGMHEYYEVVSPTTADDNDVAASLKIIIPPQAQIVEAALIGVELATSDHGAWALEVHNAAVADDAASGGTEIVGEDVSGDVSVPDNDLDTSNNAAIGSVIHMGTLANVQRSTAVTHLHVTAKEDCSSMTGTPKVGVYVKWFGYPAQKIA